MSKKTLLGGGNNERIRRLADRIRARASQKPVASEPQEEVLSSGLTKQQIADLLAAMGVAA
jgi:hypothetical protein